jgi:uncharacterized protein
VVPLTVIRRIVSSSFRLPDTAPYNPRIMSREDFTMQVADLVGHLGARRDVTMTAPLDIHLELADTTDEPATIEVRLDATTDGVVATGRVTAEVTLRCNRCLVETVAPHTVPFSQVFGFTESEDVEPITENGVIDLEPVAHDELALALPLTPLCRPDCAGLCPACGTDLNMEPCSGHADASDSPFAALKDLLDPET